jgi:cation/acetate symporter
MIKMDDGKIQYVKGDAFVLKDGKPQKDQPNALKVQTNYISIMISWC